MNEAPADSLQEQEKQVDRTLWRASHLWNALLIRGALCL
jgi:hypothetical protein